MKNIEWTDALSVDIEEIDNQHQELIKLVNELAAAIKTGKENEILDGILARLKEYAVIHFVTEERLMKTHGYPDLGSHRKEHEEFRNQVLQLTGGREAGKSFIPEQLANFLMNWITSHIQKTDMQYSAFLQRKGVR